MESITEIAMRMARCVAREQGCALTGFTLDDVDIEHADGVEIVHVRASIQITPTNVADEIPFELDAA